MGKQYQQHTKRAVYGDTHTLEVPNSDGVHPTSKDIISFWGVCDFVVFGSRGCFFSVISPSVRVFCIMVVSREGVRREASLHSVLLVAFCYDHRRVAERCRA
jgi:radical SAM superfamily enzyme YgiQ (UPF0313 family)